MSSFKKYATRDAHNAGARMIILDADGKPTQDWIDAYGMDSDAGQASMRQFQRERIQFIGDRDTAEFTLSDEYQAWARQAENRILKASYVKAWSFAEPTTPENIVEMLESCPHIGQQLDVFVGKRANFKNAA